ncbi:MAG: metal ABC transporter permease [Deltaproteobacteria bacterium]|nr:metal ABC transporter permease [Candidatus Anaeroferrophillacea bacterium]
METVLHLIRDIAAHEFLQRALIAGALVSLAGGIMGTLVVVNRLVFLAGGIAHAAFGGVGLASLLRLPVLPVTALFTLAAAGVMGRLALWGQVRNDTIIGALWAVGMGFGVICIELSPGYHPDLMGYLFGSILAVSRADLWLLALMDLLIVASVAGYAEELIIVSCDEEYARVVGLPVDWIRVGMLLLVSLAIIMLVRVVGLIMVIALLTIPAAAAERFTRSIRRMMAYATLYGLACTLTGLGISFVFDLASGAVIVMTAAAGYLLLMAGRRLRPDRGAA